MRMILISLLALSLVPLQASGAQDQKKYRWVDENGEIHYSDSIPAEYADMEKHIVNDHGIKTDRLRGKKTAEETLEEERLAEIKMQVALKRRADQALLATYISIEEILMHRDRRVELFQAQAKVTELYLRNVERRLDKLMAEASNFQPYSKNPEAPMINADLSDEIAETKETIERHKINLLRFKDNEKEIIDRFEIDINRFRQLKGLNKHAAVNEPVTIASPNP